jgi:hypothetical protein
MNNYAVQVGLDAGLNVVKEFWPDIQRGHKRSECVLTPGLLRSQIFGFQAPRRFWTRPLAVATRFRIPFPLPVRRPGRGPPIRRASEEGRCSSLDQRLIRPQ